jgi:hypothetical protein
MERARSRVAPPQGWSTFFSGRIKELDGAMRIKDTVHYLFGLLICTISTLVRCGTELGVRMA